MKLLQVLEESERFKESKLYKEIGGRDFKPLLFPSFFLSVQMSAFHRCEPKKYITNLSEYKSAEFAIIDYAERKLRRVGDVLPSFSRLAEIETYFDGNVYAYVPISLINQLYEEIIECFLK